jgi:hypothetical protein
LTRQRTCNSLRCNELGEEGLIYFNARYYDPTIGRFITEDPSAKGTGWYNYCNNNPLTYTDPTGRKEVIGASPEEDERKARERRRRERDDEGDDQKLFKISKWRLERYVRFKGVGMGRFEEYVLGVDYGKELYNEYWRTIQGRNKVQWQAHAVEISWGGYFAGGWGGGLIEGRAYVGFENVQTGEYFTAEYTFKMTDVKGAGVSFGSSIVTGITYGEFEPGTKPADIAESYEDKFKVLNVSGGPSVISLSGSFITSENWKGWETGVGPGKGMGVSWQTFEYTYVKGSISPMYGSREEQQQAWIDKVLYGE